MPKVHATVLGSSIRYGNFGEASLLEAPDPNDPAKTVVVDTPIEVSDEAAAELSDPRHSGLRAARPAADRKPSVPSQPARKAAEPAQGKE